MSSAAQIVAAQYRSGGSSAANIPAQSTAAYLTKWRAARAKTKQNFTGYNGAKLLLLGHSHIAGSGASNSSGYNSNGRLQSLPAALQRMFAYGLCPANSNSQIGFGNTGSWVGSFDSRWTTTNWTYTLAGTAIGGAMSSVVDGATLSFLPGNNVTTFVVWYAINGTRGSFNVNVDGGTNTLIDANNATPALGKYTVNVAAGAHTLNIIKSGTTTVTILGVEAYNTALTTGFNDEIQIMQAGHSGALAATFSTATDPWSGLNQITSFAPDLTYIQLSINDWVAGTPIANFKASVQALITAAKVSGDVILSTDCPSSTAAVATATQMQYVTAIKELAQANNCLVYDLYARLGSYDITNAAGMMADTLHGNSLYYADSAQGLYNLLSI